MKRCYICFKTFDDALEVCPYCGQVHNSKPKEPIQLVPGTELNNRFIIGMSVNQGGFGIVYRAWDKTLETVVAIKEFFVTSFMIRAEGSKEVVVSPKAREEYTYRKERFLAEARNLAKFGSHRNIPNVLEFFEENNTAYFVMELLKGMSLKDYINNNNGIIDVDFTIHIANEVGNALKSLHSNGIVHRDVAPDNIFICAGKEINIKLIDLGAAKLTDGTADPRDSVVKPGYSPVEQYPGGGTPGPWMDIYALGVTMYVALTGIKPDEATNRKQEDTVKPPRELNPAIPENLSNAIMKAMALEHHMRFKSVDDFLKAINGEKKVVSLDVERRKKKLKKIIGIVAALIVLTTIGLIVGKTFSDRKMEGTLKPATITVWFSVSPDSNKEDALKNVFKDFQEKFEGVVIEYKAIPEEEYIGEIKKAAENKQLPSLFESTMISDDDLTNARSVENVLRSKQRDECLFLDQYNSYYQNKKRLPLAIEVPLAYVITSGNTSVEYNSDYFKAISDFGADVRVSYDERYKDLLEANYDISGLYDSQEFFDEEGNTSPVLMSSSMAINDIRQLKYAKKYVYPNENDIKCRFTYEWSLGKGQQTQEKAAERLLSWMLGNVYQRMLMVNSGGNNQVPEIPVNKECFEMKARVLTNLSPVMEIYKKFSFKK